MAIDKPCGWMFVPLGWSRTDKNLQLALESSIREAPHWVRRRNLRYLRYIHRLDAETTGVVLLAKSAGALETYAKMFERREMSKRYLAVVEGVVPRETWRCELALTTSTGPRSRVEVDPVEGREAITDFRTLSRTKKRSLIEARPITGRTHQIRAHLGSDGFPIVGDWLYRESKNLDEEPVKPDRPPELGLRSVELSYRDPFTRREVRIEAPSVEFLSRFGFGPKPGVAEENPKADGNGKPQGGSAAGS